MFVGGARASGFPARSLVVYLDATTTTTTNGARGFHHLHLATRPALGRATSAHAPR